MSLKLRVWSLNPSVLRLAKLFAITLSDCELASKPESGIENADIYLPPVSVEFEVVAAGVPKLPYRFISALGSVLGVNAGVETRALAGEAAAELPAPATWAEAGEDDASPVLAVPELLDDEPVRPLSVWLMEISWSNWFRDTIWPTIAVGSTGEVGS